MNGSFVDASSCLERICFFLGADVFGEIVVFFFVCVICSSVEIVAKKRCLSSENLKNDWTSFHKASGHFLLKWLCEMNSTTNKCKNWFGVQNNVSGFSPCFSCLLLSFYFQLMCMRLILQPFRRVRGWRICV